MWGEENVETRLMGDGSVVDIVPWQPEDSFRPGGIVATIIERILNIHFFKSKGNPEEKASVDVVADFSPIISKSMPLSAELCAAGDALAREIMHLPDQVVAVTDVQGTSPVFGRYDPCPPQKATKDARRVVVGPSAEKKLKLDHASANRFFCPPFQATAESECSKDGTIVRLTKDGFRETFSNFDFI